MHDYQRDNFQKLKIQLSLKIVKKLSIQINFIERLLPLLILSNLSLLSILGIFHPSLALKIVFLFLVIAGTLLIILNQKNYNSYTGYLNQPYDIDHLLAKEFLKNNHWPADYLNIQDNITQKILSDIMEKLSKEEKNVFKTLLKDRSELNLAEFLYLVKNL